MNNIFNIFIQLFLLTHEGSLIFWECIGVFEPFCLALYRRCVLNINVLNDITKLSKGFPRFPLRKDFYIFFFIFDNDCQNVAKILTFWSQQCLCKKTLMIYNQINIFIKIMYGYHCRTIHYFLTATTRCILFDKQLLYMEVFDGRPLGHVGVRQLFSFSLTSMDHLFSANIRANMRGYQRGFTCNNFLSDIRVLILADRIDYSTITENPNYAGYENCSKNKIKVFVIIFQIKLQWFLMFKLCN